MNKGIDIIILLNVLYNFLNIERAAGDVKASVCMARAAFLP